MSLEALNKAIWFTVTIYLAIELGARYPGKLFPILIDMPDAMVGLILWAFASRIYWIFINNDNREEVQQLKAQKSRERL